MKNENEFRKKLTELVTYYADDVSKEVLIHIRNNPDRFLSEKFMENIDSSIGWKFRCEIAEAEADLEFQKKHADCIVTLDQQTGEMLFGKCRLPAYWYRKRMSRNKIDQKLTEYRKIWAETGFLKDIRYPMMESFYPLADWMREYGNNDLLFQKMEKDLECLDSEESWLLFDELEKLHHSYQELSSCQIEQLYPFQIRKILKVNHLHAEDDLKTADVTIRLSDRRQCTVRMYVNRHGNYRGMTTLGRRGFPMFSKRDIKLLEKEVFGEQMVTEG